MSDIEQFKMSHRPLPSNKDSFEETVQNFGERGWTAEEIADQLYRTQSFQNVYSAPHEKAKPIRGTNWPALLRRVHDAMKTDEQN